VQLRPETRRRNRLKKGREGVHRPRAPEWKEGGEIRHYSEFESAPTRRTGSLEEEKDPSLSTCLGGGKHLDPVISVTFVKKGIEYSQAERDRDVEQGEGKQPNDIFKGKKQRERRRGLKTRGRLTNRARGASRRPWQ